MKALYQSGVHCLTPLAVSISATLCSFVPRNLGMCHVTPPLVLPPRPHDPAIQDWGLNKDREG